jgi:hypothetical protein
MARSIATVQVEERRRWLEQIRAKGQHSSDAPVAPVEAPCG